MMLHKDLCAHAFLERMQALVNSRVIRRRHKDRNFTKHVIQPSRYLVLCVLKETLKDAIHCTFPILISYGGDVPKHKEIAFINFYNNEQIPVTLLVEESNEWKH